MNASTPPFTAKFLIKSWLPDMVTEESLEAKQIDPPMSAAVFWIKLFFSFSVTLECAAKIAPPHSVA